ncbi:MAG: RnfABCDGE type electron transport complex subunit B [Clostridiales bacterium]|nr:RnfABCDGE type electron transport complex subunit B [Clostridiales bacterium]
MPAPITILYSTLILFGLAVISGLLLAVFGTKFAVKKDERLEKVEKSLAGANCGACGFAGCADYARALVEGKTDLNACPVTSSEKKDIIAGVLGVANNSAESNVVVRCVGGNDAEDKYDYMGYGDCRSMELLAGGRKQCNWGCLGTGSCANVCPTHAVTVRKGGYAKIEQSKCIQCGKCIHVCPKELIWRVPKTAKVYIACRNCGNGKEVRAVCKKGCISCGICARSCPHGAIKLINNLPVINYEKCTGCNICVEKCPAKCILTIEK